MSNTDKEVMQQALDVLRGCLDHPDAADAIAAIDVEMSKADLPASPVQAIDVTDADDLLRKIDEAMHDPADGDDLIDKLEVLRPEIEAFTAAKASQTVEPASKDSATWCQYIAGMIETYLDSAPIKEDREAGIAAIIKRRLKWLPAAPVAQAAADVDLLDMPLPCDVVIGHGTHGKGTSLRSLVSRMKTLYEMATGANADEVAGRTPEQRAALWESSPLNLVVGGRFKQKLTSEAQSISDQLDGIEQTAAVGAVEQDAKRYRFLRAEAYKAVIPHGEKINGSRTAWITKLHPGANFDQAIDAAIAAKEVTR
jgi:hypothetical protein